MDPYDFDPYDDNGRRKRPSSSRSKTKPSSLSISIPTPHPLVGNSKSSTGSTRTAVRSPQSFLREKRLQDAASKLNFQNTLKHEIDTRTYQLRQTLAEINIICVQLGMKESYSVDEEVFENLSVNLNGYFIRKENSVTNKLRMMNIHAFFEEFEKTKALSLREKNLKPAVRYTHDQVVDKATVVTTTAAGTATAAGKTTTTTSAVAAAATVPEHRRTSLFSEYSQSSGSDHRPSSATLTTASNNSIKKAEQSTQRLLAALHASKIGTGLDLWNEPKREIKPARTSNHLLPQREIASRQAMVLESTVAMVKEIESQIQNIRDRGWNSL